MNFLDAYGITSTGTSTPPPGNRPEQSLEEEVSQVIGTLGRFWGGFRKQGEAAFATARRDLTQAVSQAQREFEKLTTAAPADPSTEEEHTSGDEQEENDEDDGHEEGSDAGHATPIAIRDGPTGIVGDTAQSSSTPTAQSFLGRIQSSLPPNIVSTMQAHLPDTLKNAQNIDFTQLRNTLSTEFQRVQGVTRTQAEEYVHRSEVILREAMREASEVIRDAVKVIPPEEADGDSNAAVVWDGTDIWMLPGLSNGTEGNRHSFKGKEKEDAPGRRSEDALRAVATRAESLLKQLRGNPEIIKVDPAVDSSKESYIAWVDDVEASGTGFGTKVWSERIAGALSDPSDGSALQDTLDILVPSYMPGEVFWIRYFFRVHQIEQEECKRKAFLQAATDKEEDFSWEDEEDESTSPTAAGASQSSVKTLASSQRTLAPRKATAVTDEYSSSLPVSPRLSSEDSYDVVSENVSNAGDAHETSEKANEDEDSDWE
ncbi:hypothetical protein V8B97DRAFT_1931405 [Scleroderma yunnanense]